MESIGGTVDTTVKKLNGARLRSPAALTLDTHAIGLGTTLPIRSLYTSCRLSADGSISTKLTKLACSPADTGSLRATGRRWASPVADDVRDGRDHCEMLAHALRGTFLVPGIDRVHDQAQRVRHRSLRPGRRSGMMVRPLYRGHSSGRPSVSVNSPGWLTATVRPSAYRPRLSATRPATAKEGDEDAKHRRSDGLRTGRRSGRVLRDSRAGRAVDPPARRVHDDRHAGPDPLRTGQDPAGDRGRAAGARAHGRRRSPAHV